MFCFPFQCPENPKRKLPPKNDYGRLPPLPPLTRGASSEKCKCLLCTISSMKLTEYKQYVKSHSNPVGAPAKEECSPVETLKLCSKCFAVKAQGKPHVCKKGNFSNNIESLIKKRSPKTKSNLTSALLKNVVTESEKDLRGVSISLKSGSKCLPVTVGTPKVQKKSEFYS